MAILVSMNKVKPRTLGSLTWQARYCLQNTTCAPVCHETCILMLMTIHCEGAGLQNVVHIAPQSGKRTAD